MSNYTQTTFFTPKDSLPITDPNKTIFGAAYDVEYANVATAIASKLDSVFVNPSLTSLNLTSNFVPTNGFNLNAANTIGFSINTAIVATLTATIFTVPALNVTGSTVPANGFYLPSANTLGIAANTTSIATFATGGVVFGGATGGAQGAGSINATGLYVNGVPVGATLAPVVGSGSATLSAAGIQIGQSYIVWRNSDLSRNTTVTLTSDPVLQFTNVPVGTYNIFIVTAFTTSGSATQGYQLTVTNTAGTLTNSSVVGNSICTSASSSVTNLSGGTTTAFGAVYANIAVGVSSVWTGEFQGQGSFIVSGTATIAFQWAQSASSATNTILRAGSYMQITRVA